MSPDTDPGLDDSAPVDELIQVIEAKVPTRVEDLEPARIRKIPFSRDGRGPTPASSGAKSQGALHGHCNLCGWEGSFHEPARGREGHFCGNCASTSRHRMVVHGLSMVLKMAAQLPISGSVPLYAWSGDHHLRILEASGRGVYPTMLADRFQYQGIEFDPEHVDSEDPHKGFGDLQKLHFASESFDVVIASDVFEHVRDDDAGYAEIYRVLRCGGALVLTVPYEHHQEHTIARVDSSGEEDVQLLPPVYHSGGGQTLVYRDYGRDLLTKLRGKGFTVIHVESGMEEMGITRQSLILAFKKDFVEWVSEDSRMIAHPALGPLLPQRMYLLLKFNLAGLVQQFGQAVRRLRAH